LLSILIFLMSSMEKFCFAWANDRLLMRVAWSCGHWLLTLVTVNPFICSSEAVDLMELLLTALKSIIKDLCSLMLAQTYSEFSL